MSGGKWIRLSADAIEDPREEAQAHMLESYPSLVGRYEVGDGNMEVFYLKNATATIYNNDAEPVVITF